MPSLQDVVARIGEGSASLSDVRSAAAKGQDAIDALGEQLAAGRVGPVTAATFLRMVGSSGAIAPLVDLTRQGTAHTKASALQALGHSRAPDALPPLVRALENGSLWVDAADALGRHGSEDARAALRDVWTRQLGDDWRAAVEGALSTGDTMRLQDWISLAGAMARAGSQDGSGLVSALSSYGRDDPDAADGEIVRIDASAALCWFTDDGAVRAALAALEDDESEVAENAVRAVASFGTVACLPALVDRYEQEDYVGEAVFQAAYELLGEEAPPEGAAPSDLRRWWMQASPSLSATEARWLGAPASPSVAIELLDDPADGGLARTALELWTGIDFADDSNPGVAGDDVDRARAQSWWQRNRAMWQVGAVYRGGQVRDIAPMVSAFASHAG